MAEEVRTSVETRWTGSVSRRSGAGSRARRRPGRRRRSARPGARRTAAIRTDGTPPSPGPCSAARRVPVATARSWSGPASPTWSATSSCSAWPGTTAGRRPRPLIALGQLTDMHMLDAQSPARVEFLDRYNDPDSPFAAVPALPELLPRPGDAHPTRRRGDGPGPAPGPARPGDGAAPVVRDHHRRQRRQHPAQRAPLADRPARRRTDPAGLG